MAALSVKQFIAPLTEPLGAIWLFMALGVLWLGWRRQWRSALWLGVPTLVLFIFGSTSLVDVLVAREEARWAVGRWGGGTVGPADGPVYDAVVALGGGQIISHHDLLGFAARDGASRLLTAVELVRLGKAKTLVLGGSWPIPGKPGVPSMSVVQDWIVSWGCILQPDVRGQGAEDRGQSDSPTVRRSDGGVALRTEVGGQGEGGRSDGWAAGLVADRSGAACLVTNLGICINTHDEAVAFRKLKESQGWHKVILVTSALHMRRSEALFRKQGVEVLPVAADFESYGVPQEYAFSPFPGQHRFSLLARYLHEKIGWWVYRFKGWV